MVKVFPYLFPSVGPGADPGVHCTGMQLAGTISHPPGGRLPLLSTRPAVTFPATEHHRPLATTRCTTYKLQNYERRSARISKYHGAIAVKDMMNYLNVSCSSVID